MNANLHHLQLFYFVAKAHGISAAVKIIPWGIQQPAVSQQINQLEADLNLKLFERRPFSLTPAGEKLYHFVAPFFDQLDAEITSLQDAAGIRLRFGCPLVISANYLPELIARLLKERSDVQPHINELEGTSIFASLLNREIDLAITFAALPRAKTISSRRLLTLPLALIVPEKHRFASDGFWAKSDFANTKWIGVQEQTGATHDLREGLTKLGLTPDFAASTNSIEAALNYVAMGLGIALMAQPPADLLKPRGLIAIPATELFGEVQLHIAWRRDAEISEKLLRTVVGLAAELSDKHLRALDPPAGTGKKNTKSGVSDHGKK